MDGHGPLTALADAVVLVMDATWVDAAHAAQLLADAHSSVDAAIFAYFVALDTAAHHVGDQPGATWDRGNNIHGGADEAAVGSAHVPAALTPSKRVLEPEPAPASAALSAQSHPQDALQPLPFLDALSLPEWSYLLQCTGIEEPAADDLLRRAGGLVSDALALHAIDHRLIAVHDSMKRLCERAQAQRLAELEDQSDSDGEDDTCSCVCDGFLVHAPAGDILHVESGGFHRQIRLACRTSLRGVPVSQVPAVQAGYPFSAGLNLEETLFCLWPRGLPSPFTTHADSSFAGDNDLSDEDTGRDWPIGVRDISEWAWHTATRMRDIRIAHEAGDQATYQYLMYGGDGRSTADIEAAEHAREAALPAWAAWRAQQHKAAEEALEAAIDGMEEDDLELYDDVDVEYDVG